MKPNVRKRLFSAALAMIMVLSLVPVKAQRVAAEEPADEGKTTHTFTASEDVTPGADKDAIPAGTTYADGYFKVVGTVTQRYQESKGGVYCVEIAKNNTGALEFTVSGSADVTVVVSSTGGTNTSTVGLINVEDGSLLTNNEGILEVTGTSEATLTYTGLAAGTYQILSPESSYGRGFRLYSIRVDEGAVSPVTTEHTFTASEDVTPGADKDAIPAGTTYADGYFKVVGTVTQRYQESKGGVYCVEIAKNNTGALEFTVSGSADVTVVVSSTGGTNTSTVGLINAEDGSLLTNNEGILEVTGTSEATLTYTGLAAGTYQILSPESSYGRGFRLYSVHVIETSGGSRPARKDWALVSAPAITDVKVDGKTITVSFDMEIGYDGADSVNVTLTNAEGNPVDSASFANTGSSGSVTLTPGASGKYHILIVAVRADETDKACAETTAIDYVLPLEAPYIYSATSTGGGKVNVVWGPVAEAEQYEVYCDGNLAGETAATEYEVTGLTVGNTYSFTVVAVRGGDRSPASAPITAEATKDAQTVWGFTAYGSSTNTSSNGYTVNDDGTVTVYSEGGKGKIVPASTDGVAFYYTAIPTAYNFTLRAKVSVDSWTFSNGQEGFGLLATDRLGTHGSSAAFWNNQYMASVTKNEYTSEAGVKYSMKLGVNTIAKTGATPENLPLLEVNDSDTVQNAFSSVSTTLEGYAADLELGAGTYNIVGNFTSDPGGTVMELTEFILEIQRNNTGYFITYYDTDGNIIGRVKNYDPDALSKLDSENVYVGFFAARNARVTVSDVSLSTILASEDAPAEDQPITYVTPSVAITSGSTANSDSYTVYINSNVSGTATVSVNGTVVAENVAVTGGERCDVAAKLTVGSNKIAVTLAPDPEQDLGDYTELTNADPVTAAISVSYVTTWQDQTNLYVSPTGTVDGAGTKRSPLDIYTAVSYAQPGQMIILTEGTYELTRTLRIEHGIDGTEDACIYMIADPEAATRPVLDFQGACAGIVHGGDYWYFQGFDVTNSKDGEKGFQVSGHHNVLDQINTYRNGNTGIQISRYAGTDPKSEWPSYNTILNCTSHNNADPGYEDADGFACKLTSGEGNVFDGCLAYHNADDGWDLYAKVESGSIGAVTIINCVAYENGYIEGEDGELISAGNGNGFKMGGESLSGKHTLINSYSFFNKAKGFDSNSCPDIIVYHSTSYNNESYNVAFYTNNAPNTNFIADGIISFKDNAVKSGYTTGENLKPAGTQDTALYLGDTNYYWNGSVSKNASGSEITADLFVSLEFKGVLRNADGTLNLQGFLELKETVEAGAVPGGTASRIITVVADAEKQDPSPSSPTTGDMSMPMLWLAVMGISAAALCAILLDQRKRHA